MTETPGNSPPLKKTHPCLTKMLPVTEIDVS